MKRSLRSRITELILELVGTRKVFLTKANADEYMNKKAKENSKEYLAPFPYSKKMESFYYQNIKFFYLPSKSNDVMLYIPGGAFVANPHILQWNLIFDIHKRTNYNIIIPIYPKAPTHTYMDTYPTLISICEKIQAYNPKKFAIVGDSAGGNISLSLACQLKLHKIKSPDNIILFSPCLDLTMNYNDIKLYEKVDPMLGVDGLFEMYKAWSGSTELSDPVLSPINADLKDVGKISLFVGTHEIFLPEARNFFNITLKQRIEINYFEVSAMNHVYVAHPIPEAKFGLKHVEEILKI